MPSVFRNIELSEIATATTLSVDDNDWTVQNYVHPMQLTRVVNGIDTFRMDYDYGTMIRREGVWKDGNLSTAGGVFAPLDLTGQFVRLRHYDGGQNLLGAWYGRIGPNELKPHGSVHTTTPTGEQQLTAHGLLLELDRVQVTGANVYQSGTTTLERIARGLPFNRDSWPTRSKNVGPDGPYVFSDNQPELSDPAELWTASQAIEYLLEYEQPRDANGNPVCKWKLVNGAALDWYTIEQETDRLTVKQLLDRLVDRRRLAGYYLEPLIDGTDFVCEIRIFTYNDQDVTLPSGTILANPKTTTMVVDEACDLAVSITDDNDHVYDEVRGEGEFMRVTFSIHQESSEDEDLDDDSGLIGAWNAGTVNIMRDGVSNQAGYGNLSDDEKEVRNEQFRNQEQFRHVLSAFSLPYNWNPKVGYTPGGPQWWAFPNADKLGSITSGNTSAAFSVADNPRPKIHYADKRFSDRVIGDDDLQAFAIFRVDVDEAGQPWYQVSHRMGLERRWTCDLVFDQTRFSGSNGIVASNGPKLDMRLQGAPQWFLDFLIPWTGAGADGTHLEDDMRANGRELVNYRHCWWTLTMEDDQRVGYYETINTPPDGVPPRILNISLPGRRLDLMVPNTITDVDEDGEVVQVTNGKILRDDREEIETITKAAAAWYRRRRRAIRAEWKQLNAYSYELGMIIDDIGSNYAPTTSVASVITSMTLNWPGKSRGNVAGTSPGTTSIQTSFATPNFAELTA